MTTPSLSSPGATPNPTGQPPENGAALSQPSTQPVQPAAPFDPDAWLPADRVPSNWDIKPHFDETPDKYYFISASGRKFEGTIAEFNIQIRS